MSEAHLATLQILLFLECTNLHIRILANSHRAREAIEALHSGEHSVHQFMQLDPYYRSMRLQH